MKKYLLDANIYIDCYERFFLPDLFPTFWEKFAPLLNEYVILPKIILNECGAATSGKDDSKIVAFIKEIYEQDIINHTQYALEWTEMISYINANEYYQEAATLGWSKEKIADPWILGIAKKEGYTLVSEESSDRRTGKQGPFKNAKIPDIAHDFGIECISRNEFFSQINLIV